MRRGLPAYLRGLLCSAVLLMNFHAHANHLVGMDLFYTYVSGNTYKITLVAYANCGSAGIGTAYDALSTNTPAVYIYNGGSYVSTILLAIQPPSAGVEITPVCPADLLLTQCTNIAYTIPGIKKFVYSGTYTLSGPSSVWRFLFTGDMTGTGTFLAGRATSITNISSIPDTYIQLVDTLNNTVYNNTSPNLSVVPTPFFCLNNNDNYNPGATDPDGDALTFSLVTGMAGTATLTPGVPVTYIGGYTPTAPLAATYFVFDPLTGQMSFYPNLLQRSLVVYNIEEHRSGVFTGTSQREMTFLVLTCTSSAPTGGFTTATNGTIDDSTHFHICAQTGPFAIHINPTESDTSNNITVTSSGIPTGATFTITGNGTNKPHCTFSWTSTGVTPGSYTFYVTFTDNNCPLSGVQTLAYTVTILPAPTISTTLLSKASCTAQAGISIIPGGTGSPWIIKVANGSGDTIQTFTGITGAFTDSLLPGVYTITIFTGSLDACSALTTITIVAPVTIITSATFTNPTYCGASDGTIKLHHLLPGAVDTINYDFGGVPQPAVALLVAADSTVTLTGLIAGVYSNITVTYRYCTSAAVGPVTLTNPVFTMRAITFTNPDYCGDCNGTITLYGLHPGQTDTLTYTLDGAAQPPVIQTIAADSLIKLTGLCAGTYAGFVARTAGVCGSATLGPVTLKVPPFTMRAISSTNPSYCGFCNGTVTIYGLHPGEFDTISYTLDGTAQPPVSVFIPADSMVVISGLCAGIYAKFIAKNGGCISNTLGPVTLTAPAFTMRAISFTNPAYCGDCNGTITLYGLFPGETDTINYTLGGVAQTPVSFIVPADSMVTLTGLCAGVYDNFVANTGGVCISNKLGPVTLTVPPFVMRAISSTNPDYCGVCNGTVTLYGLHPGETDTINYTKDGVPQTAVSFTIPADSMVTLTGLCAGVYDNFVATTGGICISNKLGPVTLTVPPFTMRALTFTNPDYCGICNGTITIYGLHPGETDTLNYTIGGVAQTPIIQLIGADSMIKMTGLCAGLYDNFVANTGGVCVSNVLGPANLTVPPFTMRALTFTNPDYCGICNGTITIYGLHPGELDTLNYTVGGVPQAPIIQLIGADSMIKMTGLCAGDFDNFIARTGGVCVSNKLGPADLTVPPFTMRAITFTNPTKCGFCDGTITLYGLHPGEMDTLSYSINGIAQTPLAVGIPPDSMVVLTDLCEGVYADFVARTGGVCVSNTLGPVTLKAPPIIAGFTYDIHKTCKADTVYFTNTSTPASDLTYTWYFGDGTSTTATNPVHVYTLPGVVKIRLIITNTKCYDSSIQFITLDNLIEPGFTSKPDSFLCQGKPVTFTNTTIGTLLSYTWYYGDGYTDTITSPVHIYPYTGIYHVLLTIANYVPCYDTVIKTLSVDSMSFISVLATDTVLCGGHDVTFTGNYSKFGNTGVTWTFSDGSTVQNIDPVIHAFPDAGFFPVTVEAFYRACPDTSATTSIRIFGYPTIYLGSDTSICLGSAAIPLVDNINEGNKHARWLWSTGETTPAINVVQPGNYEATVTINGCSASDTVVVLNDCYMDIPNVFTPNGDGVNDYFFPRTLLAKGLVEFSMEIYNRWGQMIFSTTSTDGRGWDGKFNGVAQPEGVFIYVINGTFKDGEMEQHKGNVTLLR